MGGFGRISPSGLRLVSLPVWLSGLAERSMGRGDKIGRRVSNPDMAEFILARTFARMRRQLKRLSPVATKSHWIDYEDTRAYGDDEVLAKDRFIEDVVNSANKASILDIGCNTGRYSLAAAKAGHSVVAIDSDPAAAACLAAGPCGRC